MAKRSSIIQQWTSRVNQWKQSNKSARAWCRENKIVYNTFMGWVHRLNQEDKDTKNLSAKSSELFIELKETPGLSGITLEYQEIKIHLSSEFNEGALKRCLSVLRGARC